MAIRWMTTLNRRAADAARPFEPHAVTDVTGFALAGHAAEMAQASGVALRFETRALPLLPGAMDAAEAGLVPLGTAKNRASLEEILQVAEGVDELLVDIALDPQTSGGLLIALPPEQAAVLARQLPSAAIVGEVLEGPAGAVLLV
jgi:selenide,water dikinase